MKNYQCKYCYEIIQSSSRPQYGNCKINGNHTWDELGEVGNVLYECKYCYKKIRCSNKPWGGKCEINGNHTWCVLSSKLIGSENRAKQPVKSINRNDAKSSFKGLELIVGAIFVIAIMLGLFKNEGGNSNNNAVPPMQNNTPAAINNNSNIKPVNSVVLKKPPTNIQPKDSSNNITPKSNKITSETPEYIRQEYAAAMLKRGKGIAEIADSTFLSRHQVRKLSRSIDADTAKSYNNELLTGNTIHKVTPETPEYLRTALAASMLKRGESIKDVMDSTFLSKHQVKKLKRIIEEN